MDEYQSVDEAPTGRIDEPWFDDLRIVNSEWVEISVTTTYGRKVRYRIPRQTLFAAADEA